MTCKVVNTDKGKAIICGVGHYYDQAKLKAWRSGVEGWTKEEEEEVLREEERRARGE